MSELRVDNIVDMGGSGAPQLRKGASVTGISTITQAVVGNATINAGGINATGIVTSSSNKFVGDFSSGNITAGVMTATSSVVASNITINSGGVNASGIVSATSYQGSGANLSGIGLSIAPIVYNPDVSDSQVSKSTGIGLTFNQRVFAGTGNVTLSLTSVGSTLVENFGVGSSVTYNNDADPPNITITPSSALSNDTKYAISYPSGAFIKNTGAGSSFVGTAYTFSTKPLSYTLWTWGANQLGNLGLNQGPSVPGLSSPTQITGTWMRLFYASNDNIKGAAQTTGTLYTWGKNEYGQLGDNSIVTRSSPIQIPGTTWAFATLNQNCLAVKTDGTLWGWGRNEYGQAAQNSTAKISSPAQIPGTDWKITKTGMASQSSACWAVKTNGTLWSWGNNSSGCLGLNQAEGSPVRYSSPVQIPGTTWSAVVADGAGSRFYATRTDGTLWACGGNEYGALGANLPHNSNYSSPVQIPGTNWTDQIGGYQDGGACIRTDGTLWTWGKNGTGALGQNNGTSWVSLSSPVQVPGTTWSTIDGGDNTGYIATKTDGTIWTWGSNYRGVLGQNNVTAYSSPVQVPGTSWAAVEESNGATTALKEA